VSTEQLFLSGEFRRMWHGRDPFQEVDRLEGEVFRQIKARRTIRFATPQGSYFAKIHHGVGWREIIKNLLQLKWPVLGAQSEWAALNLLHQIGVHTMTPVAFGRRGRNPAHIQSFIITEEITNTVSIEDLCVRWKDSPPPVGLRKALIERVALTVRQMHRHGMNHRDCYICHFLLDVSGGLEHLHADNLRLYVIDLHRAQIRPTIPKRWAVKDVAGLFFSAMDIGLTRADRLRFVRAYAETPIRKMDRRFWRQVHRKAVRLYRKQFGRWPGTTS
jgi:heptose I phosphotransferase